MIKLLRYSLFLFLITSCNSKPNKNPIYGDWNTEFMYVNGEDLIGYYDNELVFFTKLSKFTEDGQLIVFLDDEDYSNVIKADFKFNSNQDSIIFKSDSKNLNGAFKVNLSEKNGSLSMKLESDIGKMHFNRINAQIRMY